MTMPTLIQNHQKQVYATSLKKGINTIQNALNQMKATEGVTEFEDTELFTKGFCSGNSDFCYSDFVGDDQYMNYSAVEEILPKYLKVVKTYKLGEHTTNYKSAQLNTTTKKYILNSGQNKVLGNSEISFYTADGMIFYIGHYGWGVMQITIDVNGNKGPNQLGRDTFELYLSFGYFADERNGKYQYDTFTKYLMQNGWKMDY